jgi:putative peptidoglycan lipid II flippase
MPTLGRLRSQNPASAATVVAILTVLGVGTGLLRDLVVANGFGASAVIDAFLVALILPTVAENFLGIALKDAVIPVFNQIETTQGTPARRAAMAGLLTSVSLLAAVLSGLSVLLASSLVWWLAPGLTRETSQLAIPGLQIASLAIVVTSLINLSGGLLQVRGFFAVFAIRSLALNAGIILAALLIQPTWQPQGLAFGLVVGNLAQLILQMAVLHRDGNAWPGFGRPQSPVIKLTLLRLTPILLATVATQVNVVVERGLAAGLPSGSISVLFYAYRLFMLPVNVVAEPIAAGIFPALAAHYSAQRNTEARQLLVRSLRWVIAILAPLSVVLWSAGDTVVAIVLQRGAFTILDTQRTASALASYGVGLVGLGGTVVLLRHFYASGQAQRAALLSLTSSVVYVVVAWQATVWKPSAESLALALSIALSFNFVGLFSLYVVGVQPGTQFWRSISWFVCRLVLALAAMVASIVGLGLILATTGIWPGLADLAGIALGVFTFGCVAWGLRLEETRDLHSRVARMLQSR